MKDGFSMFQVNFITGNANYLTVFAIPKQLESQFMNDPELVRTSLNAKAIYSVDNSKYSKDVDYYEAQIDKQFDAYVEFMLARR